MNRFLLILMVILLSFPILAEEWIAVNITSGGDTIYIGNNSITKDEQYVYYWELANYKVIEKSGVMSAKIYKQVDCNKYGVITLQFFSYKKPMGKGDVSVSYNPPKEWISPPPSSSFYHSLRVVCQFIN